MVETSVSVRSSAVACSLSRVGLVHQRDFSSNGGPFQFASQRSVASDALQLFPFQEFVPSPSQLWHRSKRDTMETYTKRRCGWIITLSRLARTKQLFAIVLVLSFINDESAGTHYARGNVRSKEAITSAMQIVADLETPTRQWTRVALLSDFPFPDC